MRLLHAIVCSDLIVDRETGSTTYIRTFEHGTVRQLPAQVPPFFVGSLWELDPKSKEPFSVGLRLKAPSGEITPLGSKKVKPTGATLHKVNFVIPGLQVKEEGRHAVQVLLRTEKKQGMVMDLPLFVFVQKPKETTKTEAKKADAKAGKKDDKKADKKADSKKK